MNKNDQEIKQARKMRNELFSMTKNLIDKWEFYLNIQDDQIGYPSFQIKQKNINQHKNRKQHNNSDNNFLEITSNKYQKKTMFEQTQQRQNQSQKSHFLNTPKLKSSIDHPEQVYNNNNYINHVNNYASMTDIKHKPYKTQSKYTKSTKQFQSQRFILSKAEIQIKEQELQQIENKEQAAKKQNYEYIYAKQEAQYLRNKFIFHLSHFHTKQQIEQQQEKLKIFLQSNI